MTQPMPRQQVLVQQFHEAFGMRVETEPTLVPREEWELRHRMIAEELEEYRLACEAGDIVEIADALGDILYLANGGNVIHGINGGPVFEGIQDSNMSKLGEDGKPILREDGKALKGPNYFRPNIAQILAEQEPIA